MMIAQTLEIINDQVTTQRKQDDDLNRAILYLWNSSRDAFLIFLLFIIELILYILAFVFLPQPCVETLMKELFIIIIATNSMKLFLIMHYLMIIEYHKIDIHKDERPSRSKIPLDSLARQYSMEELISDYYCGYKIAKFLNILLEFIVFVFGQAVIYTNLDGQCEFGKSEFNFTWGVAISYLILRYIFLGIPFLLLVIAGILTPIVLYSLCNMPIGGQTQRQIQEKRKKQCFMRLVRIDQISENPICVICLQELQDELSFIRFHCSRQHFFHTNCIQAWQEYQISCPICGKMYNNFLI